MWNFLLLDTFASVGEGEICDIYFQWGTVGVAVITFLLCAITFILITVISPQT